MSPRKKDKKIVIVWTRRETSQLIASIKAQLSKHDPLTYSRRMNVLDWEKINIPNKSTKHCKSHLDVLIKKIPRTRTLGEILSQIDVAPIREQTSPKAISNLVSSPTESSSNSNRNSPAITSSKRKSKRSSNPEVKRDSEETSQAGSQLNPFTVFAKHNYSKRTTGNSLKEQYEQLVDGKKLFWIKKAVNAVPEGVDVQTILTHAEFTLLQNDRKDESEAMVPPNGLKRKLVAHDDDATNVSNKKVRKFETTAVDCPVNDTVEEVMVATESIHSANDTDQMCSDCVSDIEMGTNVIEINPFDDSSENELPSALTAESTVNATYDLATEATEMAQLSCASMSTNAIASLGKIDSIGRTIESEEELEIGLTEGLLKFSDHCEASVKLEDVSKIEQVEESNNDSIVREEVTTESPRVFSRIRAICAGLFGRFGSWAVKKE